MGRQLLSKQEMKVRVNVDRVVVDSGQSNTYLGSINNKSQGSIGYNGTGEELQMAR